MSLRLRREGRVREIHWRIAKTEMVFKAKKLKAVLSIDREMKRSKTRTLRNCKVSRSLEIRR